MSGLKYSRMLSEAGIPLTISKAQEWMSLWQHKFLPPPAPVLTKTHSSVGQKGNWAGSVLAFIHTRPPKYKGAKGKMWWGPYKLSNLLITCCWYTLLFLSVKKCCWVLLDHPHLLHAVCPVSQFPSIKLLPHKSGSLTVTGITTTSSKQIFAAGTGSSSKGATPWQWLAINLAVIYTGLNIKFGLLFF